MSASPPRKRFTRDDVDRMDQAGLFLGERYELIDGDLIQKHGQSPQHASTIHHVWTWLVSQVGTTAQCQMPLEAGSADRKWSLPEPDVSVLVEIKPEYDQRHPRGDEAVLAVEVADSTVAFDLSRKAALYARAGVPEYWVLDLGRSRRNDGAQYRWIQIYTEEDRIAMEARPESVRLGDLLPEVSA